MHISMCERRRILIATKINYLRLKYGISTIYRNFNMYTRGLLHIFFLIKNFKLYPYSGKIIYYYQKSLLTESLLNKTQYDRNDFY